MNTKKLLKLNVFLFIINFVIIIIFYLIHQYIYTPYDPFNDFREYDGLYDEILNENNLPTDILDNSKAILNEYFNLLNKKGIKNNEYKLFYSTFDKSNTYTIKYIIIDTDSNQIISDFYLKYNKNNKLISLRTDYFYFNEDNFKLYLNSFININILNIPNNVKDKVINNSINNPNSNWNIGSNFKYEYTNIEQNKHVYNRIKQMRTIYVYF